jgi:hypothetical protein
MLFSCHITANRRVSPIAIVLEFMSRNMTNRRQVTITIMLTKRSDIVKKRCKDNFVFLVDILLVNILIIVFDSNPINIE